MSLVDEFKSCMMRKFKMTHLGLLRYFLGLEVTQGENDIFVCQRKYVADLLKRLCMTNCEVAATPMNIHEKLQGEDGIEKVNPKLFRSLVGELNYLTYTRPDISFFVGIVSRFLHSPNILMQQENSQICCWNC